jgi:hypothetical protein
LRRGVPRISLLLTCDCECPLEIGFCFYCIRLRRLKRDFIELLWAFWESPE